jgi:hypothetical protein
MIRIKNLLEASLRALLNFWSDRFRPTTPYKNYGKQLRQRIIDLKLTDPEHIPLQGCTLEEIEKIKDLQGIDYIPEVYRQFLLVAGHGAGLLFRGSDYDYNWLHLLKSHAQGLIEQANIDFVLPADALVFIGHQGYINFYFTTADHDDNPAVFIIHEAKIGADIRLFSQTLTEFYEIEIQSWLELREKEKRHDAK